MKSPVSETMRRFHTLGARRDLHGDPRPARVRLRDAEHRTEHEHLQLLRPDHAYFRPAVEVLHPMPSNTLTSLP